MSRLALRVHTKKVPTTRQFKHIRHIRARSRRDAQLCSRKTNTEAQIPRIHIIVRLGQTPVTEMSIDFISATYEGMEHRLKSVPPKVTANFGLYFIDICLKHNTGKDHEVW